ncbi:MAG: chromosome segregation protein SMC [Oscillospiraceae bacterium]|nr:chromosome segregation protein SMC [Oscillospiraceae bacterium]MCI1990656.1 chromosome segregation protein SMC [Oscillospiraceae bacterium]MCI2035249.1 chromosome segregation protein SMC [Oscillospiraceae bacterium]
MLLRSLELQGFKTFPDKTTLTFHDGITAVVGPNGSGKSNISDAVRWVLGEQSVRTLRCTKMEDVIFGGTPARKPLGFAEVTLNIDNHERELPYDADVVSVTRRYYRSGDSEYRINNGTVRLKDINELFMDTGLGRDGYSIIGQGKIDGIVAARSEDRREIFEEAAGISRFRYRKEESEHRLAQAEENLLRLHDVLSELESRVGPLREQSEKAKRYLALAEEKKNLEIGLWLATLDQSGRVLREQEDKILIAKNQYDSVEQEISGMEDEMEKQFQASNACAAKADEIRNRSAEMEERAAKKDGEASVLRNDIHHNEENIARIRGEIEQNSVSGGDLEKKIAQKKGQIQEKLDYIKARDADFDDCSARLEQLRSGVSETAGRIDDFSHRIAELTAQTTEAKVAEMTAASAISEIELRLASIRRNLGEKQKQKELLTGKVDEYRKKLEEADRRIEALTNAVSGHKMRLDARNRKKEAARQQSEKLRLDLEGQIRRAKLLEDLERNLEGFSRSVKAVMKEAGRGALEGIRGPVSRLIRVPESCAAAMETALGGAMQNIVVGTERDAKQAIAFLKRSNSGRATFLPVSTIRGRTLRESGLSACRGFVGIASELCSFDGIYRGIVESLLGRVVVAEDLDCAVAIAGKYGYRFRIVTLDGQVVNTGGSLTGGSLTRNSGLLSRATEIAKIKKQAEALRKRSGEAAAALKTALEEESAAEAALNGAKGELFSAQEERVHLDAEFRRISADGQNLEKDSGALAKEAEEAAARLGTQHRAREDARKKSEDLSRRMEEQKAALTEISGNREELDRKCGELTEEIRQIELDRLAARKDVQSLEASVREAEERGRGHKEKIEALRAEIEAARQSSETLRAKIEQLNREAETMRQAAKDAEGKLEELNGRRMEFEKQSVRLRGKEREKSEEKEKIGHDLALLEERKANLQKEYDGIVSQLWEEYELTRREAEKQVKSRAADAAQAKKRLAAIKSAIRDLGAVNVAAVDEYKEVNERYEFMKAQIADVEQSRDELIRLIGSLTRRMKELFTARFELINRNFGETFRDLFGGGAGRLALADPANALSSGIEIFVQPPGKIVTHLEALSGGEKALVAIALYFAIMKVNPPPFCVLDEIEAALDDVNVTRFASYLRRMNQNTQFIVITHRRGSMEEADVLYGVTMQDEGVSKLLEMPVSQVEEKLGIKA